MFFVYVLVVFCNVMVIFFFCDLGVLVFECMWEDGLVVLLMWKVLINFVFEYVGFFCVVKIVSEFGDILIEFVVKISFDGVMVVIDVIGGVEVCVVGDGICDCYIGLNFIFGMYIVFGVEVFQFICMCYGVGDESDFVCIFNQQQYMFWLVKKVFSEEMFMDVLKVLCIVNVIVDNIDLSELLNDFFCFVQLVFVFKDVCFSDFVFVQYLNVEDLDDDDKVVLNEVVVEVLWMVVKLGQLLQLMGGVIMYCGVEFVILVLGIVLEMLELFVIVEFEVWMMLLLDILGQMLEQEICVVGNQC